MERGITKEQSKMLQGMAILMMLYHHLFATPEALGITYFSLLRFGTVNAELKTAFFFKLCVGIYAFVSGYGLCRVLNKETPALLKTTEGFFKRLFSDCITVLKRLFSFYTQYLLVFIIFVPIGFIFFHREFVLSEFLLNLTGISSTYNGAWWYVLQYYKMLLLLPFIDCFFVVFRNKNELIKQIVFYLGIAVVCVVMYKKGVLFTVLDFFQPAFLLCFIAGFLLSKYRIYEICYHIIDGNSPKLVLSTVLSGQLPPGTGSDTDKKRTDKILNILGITAFLLVIVCRVKIAKDASSAGLDFIFVPVFSFGFLRITDMLPKLSGLFLFFGRYSTFIWLTHVFYYDHYLKSLVLSSRVSIGIYLTLLVISVTGAVLLELIYSSLKRLLLATDSKIS